MILALKIIGALVALAIIGVAVVACFFTDYSK
jgi:hypothetical protein